MNTWSADEAIELGRLLAARHGDGKSAFLLDGLLLGLDDELRERVDKLARRWERVDNRRLWKSVRHRVVELDGEEERG